MRSHGSGSASHTVVQRPPCGPLSTSSARTLSPHSRHTYTCSAPKPYRQDAGVSPRQTGQRIMDSVILLLPDRRDTRRHGSGNARRRRMPNSGVSPPGHGPLHRPRVTGLHSVATAVPRGPFDVPLPVDADRSPALNVAGTAESCDSGNGRRKVRLTAVTANQLRVETRMTELFALVSEGVAGPPAAFLEADRATSRRWSVTTASRPALEPGRDVGCDRGRRRGRHHARVGGQPSRLQRRATRSRRRASGGVGAQLRAHLDKRAGTGRELTLALRARELWEEIGAEVPEIGFRRTARSRSRSTRPRSP